MHNNANIYTAQFRFCSLRIPDHTRTNTGNVQNKSDSFHGYVKDISEKFLDIVLEHSHNFLVLVLVLFAAMKKHRLHTKRNIITTIQKHYLFICSHL